MDLSHFNNWQKQVLGSFCLLFILVLLGLTGIVFVNQLKAGRYIGQDLQNKNTITVTGKGKMYVKPDLAIIDLAVQTEKKTIDSAMQENTKTMNKIIQSIVGLGVLRSDLQTVNFQLSPRYEWRDQKIFPPSGKRVLVGYDVNQTLRVKVKNLNQIGEVIKKATEAGANRVSNLQLTLENPDKAKAQTRQEAIQKAKAQAKDLAQALGVRLGKIINVQFNSQMPQPMPMAWKSSSSAEGARTIPNIEAGENLIQTTARITYQIY